ncbi:Lyzozyme M1 (1,4-beta-N-acetylmuramidase) [Minicystis rosea]|nr:Lyzozyme M1 (1,4-beta-N-acetylmuramidase) [Minicystis rosea]
MACSAGNDEPLGTAESEMVVCPAGETVKGIDVSKYQSNVDWTSVKGAGYQFAIARISDGVNNIDAKFDQNWSGIKGVGMIRGAYQFFRSAQSASDQADIVVNAVGKLGDGDLPVTCDVEADDGVDAATYAANIKTWVDKVTAGTGKAPMIYTGKYFWNGKVQSTAFNDLPLWVAVWGATCPDLPTAWDNWAFWQYSATGSVPGISGDVDLDYFNGSLDQLTEFAGGGPDYAAKFVEQSWPYATMTMTMTVNQTLPAFITMKNVGKASWDENTRLGTTVPRDRDSAFAGSTWINPHRAAGVPKGMTVAPGEDFKFEFAWHAPNEPGTYDEFFSFVQEGAHWFGDPGQGGPMDDVIEAKIEVVEAEYHAAFVAQSFSTVDEPAIEMEPGQTLDGWIELKNVGTATWKAGETMLAPTPRDETSPLEAKSWLSATRVSTLTKDVPPGSTGRFDLSITASKIGKVTQTFGLVEEGVTWFADAPKGGGPADDELALRVVVSKASEGTGGDGGTGSGVQGEVEGKCSCDVAGVAGGSGAAWLAMAGALVLVQRRRRR